MMSEIIDNTQIRPCTEGDVMCLAGFEAEISRISFGDEAVTDPEFHARKLRESMQKNNAGMLVMTLDEGVCGWMWVDIRTNSVTKERYVNFRSFYLSPEVRGTDCGKRLMQHGLEYCRRNGAKHIVGKVHTSNIPMRSLYKECGFKATHITMEMELSQL